ncbi:MAG TPA: hypothetical protein EYP55_08720 [Anaerolineae bacterium]|nr:hypothetical protein [Anaerolineae bacterium]
MKAKVVITLDGQVSVFVEEGTFDEGRLAIARLLKELESQGLDFESVGEVEQHRHADQKLEVKHHVTTG